MTRELTKKSSELQTDLATLVGSQEREILRFYENLSPQEQKAFMENLASTIAKKNFLEQTQADVNWKIEMAHIDFESEKNSFLNTYSSLNTREQYERGITAFEEWAKANGVEFLSASYADADNFIYSLKGTSSSATIRARVAGISSFFSFLERRHQKDNRAIVHNPFRNTKARPKEIAVRELRQPTEKDVKAIIENTKPEYRLAFSLLAYDGLRVGALPGIEIKGGRYKTFSKGKEYRGGLSDETKEILSKESYSPKPYAERFLGKTHATLANALNREQERLLKHGIIDEVFNPHSFRHFFACRLYDETNDIYLLSKRLHHAGIQTTEIYLKKLNVID